MVGSIVKHLIRQQYAANLPSLLPLRGRSVGDALFRCPEQDLPYHIVVMFLNIVVSVAGSFLDCSGNDVRLNRGQTSGAGQTGGHRRVYPRPQRAEQLPVDKIL